MNTSSENPAQSIPGVAKRTHGPGACIRDRSKSLTAEYEGISYKASKDKALRYFIRTMKEQLDSKVLIV